MDPTDPDRSGEEHGERGPGGGDTDPVPRPRTDGGGRTVEAHLVDAFTEEPLTGNGAGVVPDADGLTEAQMRAIARELAQSETAFLFEDVENGDADDDGGDGAGDAADGSDGDREGDDAGGADRRVRYFTPTQEVDLCGHATIASHAHLFEAGHIGPGTHRLATNVGVLDVEVTEDGTVWMTQGDPELREVVVGYDRLGEALGMDPATLRDVGADLPVAVASTGLPFLVVPANFLSAVGDADPDMDAVEALSAEFDVTGVYLFTFDTLSPDATLHGRMFAPRAGVPEDPVTGTASGAVGVYLHAVDAFEDPPGEMTFEQGHFLDRPGRVRVRVDTDPDRTDPDGDDADGTGAGESEDDGDASSDGDADGGLAVGTATVGGRAVRSFEGRLRVPPDDDEILEA